MNKCKFKIVTSTGFGNEGKSYAVTQLAKQSSNPLIVRLNTTHKQGESYFLGGDGSFPTFVNTRPFSFYSYAKTDWLKQHGKLYADPNSFSYWADFWEELNITPNYYSSKNSLLEMSDGMFESELKISAEKFKGENVENLIRRMIYIKNDIPKKFEIISLSQLLAKEEYDTVIIQAPSVDTEDGDLYQLNYFIKEIKNFASEIEIIFVTLPYRTVPCSFAEYKKFLHRNPQIFNVKNPSVFYKYSLISFTDYLDELDICFSILRENFEQIKTRASIFLNNYDNPENDKMFFGCSMDFNEFKECLTIMFGRFFKELYILNDTV